MRDQSPGSLYDGSSPSSLGDRASSGASSLGTRYPPVIQRARSMVAQRWEQNGLCRAIAGLPQIGHGFPCGAGGDLSLITSG